MLHPYIVILKLSGWVLYNCVQHFLLCIGTAPGLWSSNFQAGYCTSVFNIFCCVLVQHLACDLHTFRLRTVQVCSTFYVVYWYSTWPVIFKLSGCVLYKCVQHFMLCIGTAPGLWSSNFQAGYCTSVFSIFCCVLVQHVACELDSHNAWVGVQRFARGRSNLHIPQLAWKYRSYFNMHSSCLDLLQHESYRYGLRLWRARSVKRKCKATVCKLLTK
jgi:hypothetical protein